ncbi:hypothetical protein B0H11DRAFT_1912862 [Mycena galericulata]|nr:hypothetical protein B0H11DRAFT_1912862 [Mycena galericulata]
MSDHNYYPGTSDDIEAPCFSQRDETSKDLGEKYDDIIKAGLAQQNARRIKARALADNTGASDSDILLAAQDSTTTAHGGMDTEDSPKLESSLDDDAQLDFELLRLEYFDMEADRDQAQAECVRLQNECTRLEGKLKETQVSLRFFQGETGRWRWAAASAHTKIQSFARELLAAAMVLRFPDGQPLGTGM